MARAAFAVVLPLAWLALLLSCSCAVLALEFQVGASAAERAFPHLTALHTSLGVHTPAWNMTDETTATVGRLLRAKPLLTVSIMQRGAQRVIKLFHGDCVDDVVRCQEAAGGETSLAHGQLCLRYAQRWEMEVTSQKEQGRSSATLSIQILVLLLSRTVIAASCLRRTWRSSRCMRSHP